MKKLDLTKIGFFNPGRLTDEEIEMSFIARNSLFQFLFKKIIEHPDKAIPQHLLIIGQRGMGKTSLLMRLAVELKKEPHKKRFIPLSYPEEQYNIDRLSKFWLNSLDALADTLDKEGETKLIKELDQEIDRMSSEKHLDSINIFEVFNKWTKKTSRWPVLLVDNLNLLFDKISEEEQHKLRAILMKPGAPIMIGASATTMEQTTDYGAPFYDAFQIQYLKKLSLEESIEILRNLAELTDKPLGNMLAKQKGRLAALYELTGGTPRTLAMLFPLISDGFGKEIQDDLDALLDMVTPLYKARFEELPTQMQVTLDAIALNWDPIDLEQLRNTTQLENTKLSPQLKRLVDVGWIQKLKSSKTRGAVYEISERFFNVWYLMRRSSRRMKRELYCLSKFLEAFYGSDVDQMAQQRLTKEGFNSKESVYLDLALAAIVNEKNIKEKLEKRSYDILIRLSKTDSSILQSFEIPSERLSVEMKRLYDEINKLINKDQWAKVLEKTSEAHTIDSKKSWVFNAEGLSLRKLSRYPESESAYKKAIELNEKNAYAWSELGDLYTNNLGRYSESESAYKKAVEVDEKYDYALTRLGDLYANHLDKYSESESAYKNALQLNDKDAYTWTRLGDLYAEHFERYSESESSYKKAIEADEKYAYAWFGLGNLYYYHLKKYEESELAYKRSIELNENYSTAWNRLGDLYQLHLGLYDKSEYAYKRAISINKNGEYSWYALGNLYNFHLRRFKKSESAYLKAVDLNATRADIWNDLGILYHTKLVDLEKAEGAYSRSIELDSGNFHPWSNLGVLYLRLENNEGAEKSFVEALKLDPQNVDAWRKKGDLYQYNLGKYDDAEKAYMKAISINKKDSYSWRALGHLYRDFLGKYNDSERAYKKAVSSNQNESSNWNSLGNLYQDHLKKYLESERAYLKVIDIDEEDTYAKYNLIFLYRDKLGKHHEAKSLLDGIPQSKQIKDSHFLNLALFAFVDQNAGNAKKYVINALEEVKNSIPTNTEDDWWRAALAAIKLGYGKQFVEAFEESGYHISLRPFYEAIKAIMTKDAELYFNTVAAEVRKPAKEIYEKLKLFDY